MRIRPLHLVHVKGSTSYILWIRQTQFLLVTLFTFAAGNIAVAAVISDHLVALIRDVGHQLG